MNRLAKGFRVTNGIIILLNIIIFFLPMTQSILENYPTKTWSQLDYVINVMGSAEPYNMDYDVTRLIWVICFIIVPLVLVLVAGIWGIVGGNRQIGSSLLSFMILGLYVGLFFTIKFFFPDDTYCLEIAGFLNILCSGISSLMAIGSMILTPKKEEFVVATEIPQLQEIKQQQVELKYNIISEQSEPEPSKQIHERIEEQSQMKVKETEQSQLEPVQQQSEPVQPKEEEHKEKASVMAETPSEVGLESKPTSDGVAGPRGVMVGLTGMYAGAEIPFADGECIRLGRLSNNDLVFDGQEKVSRNHCYIKWESDKKKYILRDFSSNGTFVKGSDECLPQNLEIPIEPGTIIEIGDEQNTFRLE